jgi:CRISPR-associated protein Cas2
MSLNKQQHFLISYDIADPKRLGRIHRVLKKAGMPVQYSVFSVVCTQASVKKLLCRLENLMDVRQDDLRCYTLPAQIECKTLGRQMFPDDVLLFCKGVPGLIGGY